MDDAGRLDMDPARHYGSLHDGPDKRLGLRLFCGSGSDVTLSVIRGSTIFLPRDEFYFPPLEDGPVFADCAEHGLYLCFFAGS